MPGQVSEMPSEPAPFPPLKGAWAAQRVRHKGALSVSAFVPVVLKGAVRACPAPSRFNVLDHRACAPFLNAGFGFQEGSALPGPPLHTVFWALIQSSD